MSNSTFKRSTRSLKYAIGLSAALGALPLAYADNQVSLYTDTAPAGDNILVAGAVDAAIGTDGVIANSTGHATGTIPTFALDLGRSNVTTDGAYTFAAAFTVYAEDTTNLRLEFYIPSFTLTFASGEASLSFPGGNATVYGRDDTGALTANATITNAMFSNPSNQLLQLDVESQLTALAGSSAGLFDAIADVIKSDGVADYVYRIFLKQTGGPAKLNLGTGDAETDSANFTAFANCPTSAELATEFLLNTGLTTTFDGAYALLGNLAFGAGALTNVNTAFSGTGCAPFAPSTSSSSSSSSGAGSSATVTEAQTDLVNADFSNLSTEQLEQVTEAVGAATSTANNISTALVNGEADADAGINALDTINTAFSLSGEAARLSGGDDAQSTDDIVNLLNSAGNLINSLEAGGTQLSSASDTPAGLENQEDQVNSAVANIASNLIDNLGGVDANGDAQGDDLTAEDAQRIANAMGTVLSGLNAVSSEISNEVVTQVRALVDVLGQKADTSIIERYLPTASSAAEVTGAGGTITSHAFKFRLDTSFSIVARSAESSVSEIISQSLDTVGTTTQVTKFFDIDILSPTTLSRVLTDSNPAGEIIEDGIGGSSVRVDDSSELVEIAVGDQYFATEFLDVRIVPSDLAEGVTVLPNGSALVVSDQFGFVGTPTARDLSSFVSTLNTDFAATVSRNRETGSFVLENADLTASVTFAFESASTSTNTATGPVTLSGPEAGANPAEAGFKYTVNYGDGSSQSLLPYPIAANFIEYLESTDVLALIDRSTGVIDMGDGMFAKPDYFVTPLATSQEVFLENNPNEFGVVIGGAGDVNGDGVEDSIIISEEGAQFLYTVP